MASLPELKPASRFGEVFITLHLYLLSGGFKKEDVIPTGTRVDLYKQLLETGHVYRCLGIYSENDWSRYYYELVWNDMVLECGKRFIDYVGEHGMSVNEPVVVTVILKSRDFPPSPRNDKLRGWPA